MKKQVRKMSVFRKILLSCCLFAAAGAVYVSCVDLYVRKSTESHIITPEEAERDEGADCVIVLGCRVRGNDPSLMLDDRLSVGVGLYKKGAAPKILMSGDHGRKDYDEVNVMKQYAMDSGVPSEDVFMDHAGFSTYDSMYRAANVFGAKKVIIVSQKYHLYRALYIAKKLGMEAYGVPSDLRAYVKQDYYDLREILARNKDFIQSAVKPGSTYEGDAVPISGNGNVTNDKPFPGHFPDALPEGFFEDDFMRRR